MPTITELLLAELDREGAGTRRTLERVPEGRNDWKPHEKSMELGYLSGLVATMPSWIKSIVEDDSLDLSAPGEFQSQPFDTNRELLEAFDQALEKAKEALRATTDEHLTTTSWQLKVQGRVVAEDVRYIVIRDSAINHLVHHRAQLTVYLRLNEAPVPALYGPSADEGKF